MLPLKKLNGAENDLAPILGVGETTTEVASAVDVVAPPFTAVSKFDGVLFA